MVQKSLDFVFYKYFFLFFLGLPSSGFSSPYTPSLSRNNSDASQYGGSQHSSCYSYSSVSPTQFSPTHSPIQSRHHPPTGSPLHVLYGMPVPRSSTTGNHLPSASNVGHLDEASDTNGICFSLEKNNN